jgi:hypothetical protein
VLQSIIDTYNKSKHRGIFNLRPIDITKENEMLLWEAQQPPPQSRPLKNSSLKLHDYVKISQIKGSPFVKNFDQNWSEETFRIVGIDNTASPIMYTLEDLQHNILAGKFYTEELQVVGEKPPSLYRIEKIIRSKGKGRYKQHLVKWHGYPSSYNSWIYKNQVKK